MEVIITLTASEFESKSPTGRDRHSRKKRRPADNTIDRVAGARAGDMLVLFPGAAVVVSKDGGETEKRSCLDDRLKDLMQELGNAINESLSDSDRIAGAIGEIKRAGYDVFLVLEATIGFNKREDGDGDESEETMELEQPPESGRRRVGRIKLTTQDQKFLKALKIAIDDDNR